MSTQPTHVLTWLPPYLIVGSKDGWWDLQPVADYDAGKPQMDPAQQSCGVPRDADPAVLAQWASSLLGHPVALTRDDQEIKPRLSLRWRTEPRYYVTPEGSR